MVEFEIDEIAAADIDGADAEPHLAAVDAVEVDEPLERAFERRGVVPAGGLDRPRRSQIRRRPSRREEPLGALEQRCVGVESVEETAAPVAAQPAVGKSEIIVGESEKVGNGRSGDLLPEGAQLVEPRLGRVAGDQRRVDRADGNPGHPLRLQVGFDQRLIDAGLERAERAAALQHQGDAVERRPLQAAMAFPQRRRLRGVYRFGRPRRSGFELDGRSIAGDLGRCRAH